MLWRKMTWGLVALMFIHCTTQSDPLPESPDAPVSRETRILLDEFQGKKIILVGNPGRNFIVGFDREFNGELLDFELALNPLPALLKDDRGNIWDIFGKAIAGPDMGAKLTPLTGYLGYWFTFGALYPGVQIYEGQQANPAVDLRTTPGWLVPKESVYQGAGFDAIKSLFYPDFIKFEFRNYPNDDFYIHEDDLIIGVSMNGELKAYPHRILDQHEVINDQVGGVDISIIYCPLTGTASIWEQLVDNQSSGFGVSGFLYSSNILPFDRHSESLWHQLEATCVNGVLIGSKVNTFHFVETTWKTWQEIHTTPLVVSENTGVDRDYSQYPYNDYRTNHDHLLYPIQYDDQRLPRKERVYGLIIDGEAKVYRFSSFD